jgi:chemotaxis methyl-accepting protein methylase
VLEVSHYPEKSYDLIICMGLTEFLDDALATEVFKIFASKLSKNGVLYTSSTDIHPFSDKLLRNIADLHTNYRTQEQLHELLEHAGLEVDHSHVTKHKLQTIVRAKKK